MCGIVCFIGRSNGIDHVLDALQLLEYRAPDSAGLAVLAADGQLVVRRCVGTGRELRATITADPLPPLAKQAQIVVGHGRWAMVGAATVENAHPIGDRSRGRVVVENGSHNASLMLAAWAEQEAWWRARGIDGPVHNTQNTTEVLVYEWERLSYLLAEATPPPGSDEFLGRLDQHDVVDVEERALRLAMWRLRAGNAHACAFYSRSRPGTLYVTSHNKPVSISVRNHDSRRELMVASDVNAALMLWPKAEVDTAAARIEQLRAAGATQAEVQAILDQFTADVIFLDHTICQGQELFARIDNDVGGPRIDLSRYDGTPLAITSRPLPLNPALADRRGYPTYTESHIAEIPAVIDDIVATYVRDVDVADGRVAMAGVWQAGELLGAGLNLAHLQQHFGVRLAQLHRLLLIGEGSSWRNAQAAAPLLRHLLPGILVNVYRPVEMLNLGHAAAAAHDLAIEISWSGTTDSLLKVDAWLAELGVTRLAVTGRPQSDLARRAAASGGILDVCSGIEVSVATVKGYQAILMTLNLLALQLAQLISEQLTVNSEQSPVAGQLAQLLAELALVVPRHVRTVIEDQARRNQIRRLAARCGRFNKVVVVGNSPVDLEAELKIEELAQVVALALDFHAASLRPLIERSAIAGDEPQRALFIVNATSAAAQRAASPILAYLRALDVFHVVHTTPGFVVGASAPSATVATATANYEIFLSPQVSPHLQPLLDAPFFFDLAVALAYARGLTPAQIDRPRNLAKSVTTTGAERRADVETRSEFRNVSLATFAAIAPATLRRSPAALAITLALQAATTFLNEPLPPELALRQHNHLVIVADTEATENGANVAAAVWQEVAGIDVVVYRRFLDQAPALPPATALLQLVRAGAVLAIHDGQTVALPEDMAPLQLELLAAIYLSGLAIRLARPPGGDTGVWQKGLVQLPPLVAGILADKLLAQSVHQALSPFIRVGYDKVQVIGGGHDFISAISIARSLRLHGFVAEALYTDSAWHGPLAAVGGPDADHDALIIILATDPLFQAAALVDTQVYRTRHAPVILVVPQGNETLHAVLTVDASAVVAVPAVPRPFVPIVNAALGDVIARQMARQRLSPVSGY